MGGRSVIPLKYVHAFPDRIGRMRYYFRAEQERLARQAIKRQSENKGGKLELDEVANTTDELLKINSLINKMALPRGDCGQFQKCR
jgi:hypothetical protein